MSIKIKVEKKQGDVYLFYISGSIDSDTYNDLEDRANPILPLAKVIIFDLEGVEYVSSMGLNTIFKVQRTMEMENKTFVMTNLQPQVVKVFEIVKALPNMKIFASIEEADAYLYKIQSDEMKKKEDEKNI